MADSSAVSAAIVAMLGEAAYPDGAGEPSALGVPVQIQRGWPTGDEIGAAVAAGGALVGVVAVPGMSKNTTRFQRLWTAPDIAAPTLTVTASGLSATFGGMPAPGQLAAVWTDNAYASYAVAAGDTPASIAKALGKMVAGSSVSGATFTAPATDRFGGIVTQTASASLEVGRMEEMFRCAVWAPSPAARDAVLSGLLPAAQYQYRLTLADGTVATLLRAATTGPDDKTAHARMWRRDLMLGYDFPQLYTATYAPLIFGTINYPSSSNTAVPPASGTLAVSA